MLPFFSLDGLPESPHEVLLDPPIKWKGGTVDRLLLREPTAGEVHRAEGNLRDGAHPEALTGYVRDLIQSTSRLDPTALDELRVDVLNDAAGYFAAWVGANVPRDDAAPVDPSSIDPSWEMPLREPIVVSGITYNSLSLSMPTLGQKRKAEGQMRSGGGLQGFRGYRMQLVTLNAGVPFPVIQAMPVSDLNAAAEYLAVFIEGGRRTTRP